MREILIQLYIANAAALVTHEIDSAYRKEWELFRLPGGINGFLIIHLFLIFILFAGLRLLMEQSLSGLLISLFTSLCGLSAFGIHIYFIMKGDQSFRNTVSLSILFITFILSIPQTILTFSFIRTYY